MTIRIDLHQGASIYTLQHRFPQICFLKLARPSCPVSCGQSGTLPDCPGPTWPHAGDVWECSHTGPVKNSSYPKKVIHPSIWTQKHVFRRQNQPVLSRELWTTWDSSGRSRIVLASCRERQGMQPYLSCEG